MNYIDRTAFIHPDAKIGKNNYFGHSVWIGPGGIIGDNNYFTSFISIGKPAEHRDYFHYEGPVLIGHGNMVREFVTINGGTEGCTQMGNNCVMLRGSHLSHDSILEDHVNVSCNVMIGGESYIMRGANLGLSSMLHQRTVVGSYAMIGMGAIVTKTLNVLPGYVYAGNPAKELKLNDIGLKRNGITDTMLNHETIRYQQILESQG